MLSLVVSVSLTAAPLFERNNIGLLDAGNSLPMVSQWIGHSSTAMTIGGCFQKK